MTYYQDKIAVITGAGSGIGRALAVDLAQRGASLALSDVNEAGLEETRLMCEGGKVTTRCYRLDVSQREEVFEFAKQVQNDFGTAHFVFNNAGVSLVATLEQSTIEEIEWLIGINLWGVIYSTKAFLPMLLAQREGHIVNVSSVFGLVGFYGNGAYNISKFGVRGLTECLWSELEGTGVRATTVHPGGIRTQIAVKSRFGKYATQTEREYLSLADTLLITQPAICARDILNGVARGKRKIITGHKSALVDWLSRLLPTLYPWVLKRDLESQKRRLARGAT